MKEQPSKRTITDAIKRVHDELGRTPSKVEFRRASGITEYQVLKHFDSWNDAVRAAGLDPNTTFKRKCPSALLEDWGRVAGRLARTPTVSQYRKYGRYSPTALEKHLGRWSGIPDKFKEHAKNRPEWRDVAALLSASPEKGRISRPRPTSQAQIQRHSKLSKGLIYGNPLDFRGLRHEPVNELGVVFLFGMVARELGYMVENIQSGFPDCEAKRAIEKGKWQKVSIEFEFESRHFRDHGHDESSCDVIVCWRHDWQDCPEDIEVIELSNVIRKLDP